jgi:hypothetical protein
VDSDAIRTIDAAFVRNRRDTKRPIIRLGGNAWPLLRRGAANRCRSDPYPPIRVRERHRDVSIKENQMSSIANLTSTPALPQLNTHPHGHKKGSHVASADDSDSTSNSNTAAPVPVGTQQNLFGSLLQSLEQVIGVQLSATAPAGAAAAATPASAAAATSQSANSPQSAGSKVNVLA